MEFERRVAAMVMMAANDCNTMEAILVLTCPLLGSGLCPFIFLLNNIEGAAAASFILTDIFGY